MGACSWRCAGFDSAYARYEHADSLIDLWIAFEALLAADRESVSSYQISLRIAWLVGTDAMSRRHAFELARRSYKTRSKIVHGDEHPKDLGHMLDDTRDLAREALRRWMLEPPSGDVQELDERFLA